MLESGYDSMKPHFDTEEEVLNYLLPVYNFEGIFYQGTEFGVTGAS